MRRLFYPNIWLILFGYLILAIAFSIASPIFEPPDELQHIYFIKYLKDTHALPVLETGGEAESALYRQEGGQPPLYYALGAVLLSQVDMSSSSPPKRNPHASIGEPLLPGNKNVYLHGADELWPWRGVTLAIHLMRFFSILLGAGTVFFVWKIAQGLFPQRRSLTLAIAAFVAFLPQFLFISAAVTNDNLVVFLSTFVLWLSLRYFGPDFHLLPRWMDALLLGIFLGFAALSKLTGLDLWLIVGLIYVVHLWIYRDWRETIFSALVTGLTAVTIAFPWYWRNWQLYDDPTALTPFLNIVGPRIGPIHPRTEFQGLRISFLGLFGWFNVPLPELIYRGWDIFLAISAIGFLQGVWRRRLHLRPLRRHAFLIVLAIWLGLMIVSLIYWISITPGTQGRLLFSAIVSLAILTMIGWREWLPTQGWWLALPPALLLIVSVYSVGWVIPDAYRSPEIITADEIPVEARRPPIVFDGRIVLLGAQAQPETVHPGDLVQITLYWQALDKVPYNASVYIHLFGRDFEKLAQVDAYPGWGSLPTSFWEPGQVIVDRYHVRLPGGAVVPTKLLVKVGLYDLPTQQRYPAASSSGEAISQDVAVLRAVSSHPHVYNISHPTDFRSDDIIRLAGYDLPGEQFLPGEKLPLTLYWQGLAPIDEDYQVFVHLVDESGKLAAGYDKSPVDGWWPTSFWEPGQIFDDSYPLILPPELPPGRYELRAGMYRLSDLYRLPFSSTNGQVIDNAPVLTKITVNP